MTRSLHRNGNIMAIGIVLVIVLVIAVVSGWAIAHAVGLPVPDPWGRG